MGAVLDSARAAMRTGDLLRADSLARLQLARSATDMTVGQRAVALWTVGASLHLRALHDSAMPYLEEARALAVQDADSDLVASIRKDMAMVYEAKGDYPRSLAMLLITLAHQERVKDTLLMANTLLSIGKVYYMQDDDAAARVEYDKARSLYERIGDSIGMSMALNNVTRIMVEHGQYDTAIALIKGNIALRERLQPKRSRAALESNLSSAYLGLERWEEALAHARVLLDEAVRHDQHEMEALGHLGIARALRGKGELKAALASAEESLRLSEALARPEQVSEAHKVIGLIDRDLKNYEAALFHADRHVALEDSLKTAERNAAMVELRTRYEVDQRTRENALLQQEREVALARAAAARSGMLASLAVAIAVVIGAWALLVRSRQRAQRRELELEQQVLRAQMDPHFLFNALNTIPGLYASGDPAAANDHLGHLSRFLRLVLETGRRRTVPLSQELEMLEHYLRISANRRPGALTWSFSVAPYVHPDRIAIPPMLLQPLVENAVEHGLSDTAGEVHLRVDQAGSVLLIEVNDTGVGRAAAAARPARRAGGLGLSIVRQRLALFDRRTDPKEAVSVHDLAAADGTPAGTSVRLRMRVRSLNDHAATGDRG